MARLSSKGERRPCNRPKIEGFGKLSAGDDKGGF